MTVRSIIPILGILLGSITTYLGISLIALAPSAEDRLLGLTVSHFSGAVVSALILPFLLARWTGYQQDENRHGFFNGIGPLLIILISSVVFRLPGLDLTLAHPWLSLAYQFCAGMQVPVAYCLFFSIIQPERRGFTLGVGVAVGILAWRFTMLPPHMAYHSGMVLERMQVIYLTQLITRAALSVVLLAGLVCFRKTLLPPSDTLTVDSLGESRRRSNIWRILAACALCSFTYCVLDARLSLTITKSYSIDFSLVGTLIILCCPVIGYCIDRWRGDAFRAIVLAYFVCLLLVPSLTILGDRPFFYHTIHFLAVIGQFAVFIIMPVALSRLVRFDRWFCLIYCAVYFMRCVSITGVQVVRSTGLMQNELVIVAATLAVVAFYLLIKGLRFPWEVEAAAGAISSMRTPEPVHEPEDEKRDDKPQDKTARQDGEEKREADEGSGSAGTPVLPNHVRQNLYRLYFHYGLSRREREVATLILEGRTTRDIAAGLDISEYTVKAHVRNLLTKCQVASRQALLAKFLTESMEDGQ